MPKKKRPPKAKKDRTNAGMPVVRMPERQESNSGDSAQVFPIVAVGASAGGLEAFTELVRDLPLDAGMAFVLIQHLDPKHPSILSQLIEKETRLPVVEVKDGLEIEPNHVYVIPPNANMTASGRTLRLTPRSDSHGQHMPVDYFMRSLAEDQGDRAIGVILSGSGSDGTQGIAEIQAQGGVTFAQEPRSAKFDSMPRNAIASGSVDFVLPPKGIARELTRIGPHPYVLHRAVVDVAELVPDTEPALTTVFGMLRKVSGIDFTYYRHTTLRRRIQRRMVVHKIDKLADYVKYLKENPSEIKALHQDALINVTSFFRNPRVFEALKKLAFPSLLAGKGSDTNIRIWVPACASGEEVYSVAIALLEFLGDKAPHIPIQLFGTDVSEGAIAKARTGVFPENIQADVSPERLRRFFARTEGGYVISKTIRDMCIFAQHNVLSDPPFSQMDLVSCRNLLIYLEPVLQKRVITLLHYSLSPDGFLVVGTSEGVGGAPNFFHAVDKENKIYSKRLVSNRPMVTFSLNRQSEKVEYAALVQAGRIEPKANQGGWGALEAQREFDRRLLTNYVPAAVFVNEDMEVIHSRGNVDRYLKLPPGRASLNLMKMAPEGLIYDLRNALTAANKKSAPIRKEKIQIRVNNQTREIGFEVVPVKANSDKMRYFMIVFEEFKAFPQAKPRPKQHGDRRGADELEAAARRIAKLEQEIGTSKEYLHSIIESQEATNEQLQSANEEVLSSNEELQSTNEELETAKEELQSTNEELNTVNEELRTRNLELNELNNDLGNLLSSVNIAIIMLGSDLSIRRYTSLAEKLIGLIPADIGRPLTNINPTLELPDLNQLVVQVMETLTVVEREVKDRSGRWYSLRILPYRTHDHKIQGAVITLVDIHAIKTQMEQIRELANQLETETARFKAVLAQLPAGIAIAEGPDGQLILANQQLEKIFGKPFQATRNLEEFSDYYRVAHPSGAPFRLDERPVTRALQKGETTSSAEFYVTAEGEQRILQGSAAPIRGSDGKIVGAVMVYSDITKLRRAEQALIGVLERDLKESREYTETVIESAREPILILDSNLDIHTANPAFFKAFGLPREAVEKKPLREVDKGELGSLNLRPILESVLAKNQRIDDFEVETEYAKRGKRTLLLNARRIKVTGERGWILLSIQDITDSKKSEALVRERAELLSLAHDAIYIRDSKDVVRFWNRGAEELYGWKADEVTGKRVSDLLQTKFPISEKETQETLIREGSWEGELIHTTKAGKEIAVTSRWALRKDEKGNPDTVLVINRDVTKEREAQAEVVQLSRHLLAAQDQERRRLARELHDTTGQKVAAININLDLMDQQAGGVPEGIRQALQETRHIAKEVGDEVRTFAYLLHPPLLDEGGLPSAVQWYVDGLAKRGGIRVEANMPIEMGRLPEEVETALFRVVQEALTNAHLHGRAHKANLYLKQKDTTVTLEIQDDGQGMPDHAGGDGGTVKAGVGIASMRERVEQLGGKFEIASGKNGTIVRVSVPLKK